jgi:hypothetical protein
MSNLGWAIGGLCVVCVVAAADYGWISYRAWRARRRALKSGRTLTAKFALDHD